MLFLTDCTSNDLNWNPISFMRASRERGKLLPKWKKRVEKIKLATRERQSNLHLSDFIVIDSSFLLTSINPMTDIKSHKMWFWFKKGIEPLSVACPYSIASMLQKVQCHNLFTLWSVAKPILKETGRYFIFLSKFFFCFVVCFSAQWTHAMFLLR